MRVSNGRAAAAVTWAAGRWVAELALGDIPAVRLAGMRERQRVLQVARTGMLFGASRLSSTLLEFLNKFRFAGQRRGAKSIHTHDAGWSIRFYAAHLF